MGTYLIDTNIVIEFLRGTPPPGLVLGSRQELLCAVSQGLDSTLVVSLPNCFCSLDCWALRAVESFAKFSELCSVAKGSERVFTKVSNFRKVGAGVSCLVGRECSA